MKKDIVKYKNRFDMLMESDLGNVKPIVEQDFEEESSRQWAINSPSDGEEEGSESLTQKASNYIDRFFEEEVSDNMDRDQVFDIIDEMKMALKNWERMYTDTR